MSQHTVELCTLLVDMMYGELTSKVFSTLLQLGRLNFGTLKLQSGLQSRQLSHALVVLIQQHLAFHYTSSIDGQTYYEANWQEGYNLIRAGKVRRYVDDRLGPECAETVSNLQLLGHTRIRDLLVSYKAQAEDKTMGASTNGHVRVNGTTRAAKEEGLNGTTKDIGRVKISLLKLMNDGVISEVRKEHFRSFTDNYTEAELAARQRSFPTGLKGTKEQAQLVDETYDRLRQWRDGENMTATGRKIGQRTKRKLQDIQVASMNAKRRKLNGNVSAPSKDDQVQEEQSEAETDEVELNDDTVVKVGLEECKIGWRNEQLTILARDRVNSTTAIVYKHLLELISRQLSHCKDDLSYDQEASDDSDQDASVSTFELAQSLDPELDLVSSLGKVSAQDVPPRKSKINHINGNATEFNIDEVIVDVSSPDPDDEYINHDLPDDMAVRIREVRAHLSLLAEDSLPLAYRATNSHSHDRWTVDFSKLVKYLKTTVIDDIIRTRWDQTAARIVRILREKGKLDERQLANIALAPQKEIRILVAEMHAAGFLELQEIPRDNARAPGRTFFLWYFDLDRCARVLIEDICKTMARLLQRCRTERESMKGLLEKAERTDVVGMEDKYLTAHERDSLTRWRETEERLLVQAERLDDAIAVLRDF